ncbi:MAG: siroheme synthase CysG [Pseudomonadota bacterium]
MKSFPMFIKTSGRRVVIAGGGEQAAQKARLMLKTDAQLVLAFPTLSDELTAIVKTGRANWHRGEIGTELFAGAAMGFVATGCPGLDAGLHAVAQLAKCPVNVVDQPDLCDLTTPSLVDRDPVVVAIGTEGTAPVLARQIKTRVEEVLPVNLGGLAAFAGRMREAVAKHVPRDRRRGFWRWVFGGSPAQAWSRQDEPDAIAKIQQAIAAGGAPETPGTGMISLVGAGPGARDLLTLRAVERLQEADVIFYDRLVDPDVLELARRDAERVFVGKVVGAHAWPQDRINTLIVGAALRGQRVVRLKSGDPSVFGRAGEEIEAARAANVPLEIVPGVTAAVAMAASRTTSLTQRDVTDTLVLTTGHLSDPAQHVDVANICQPGTTTVFYMAIGHARQIQEDLLGHTNAPEMHIQISVDVSKPTERHYETTIGQLTDAIAFHGVTGCALISLTWPKALGVRARQTQSVQIKTPDHQVAM